MYLNETPSTAKFVTYEKMENEKGEEENRSGGNKKEVATNKNKIKLWQKKWCRDEDHEEFSIILSVNLHKLEITRFCQITTSPTLTYTINNFLLLL